MSLRERERFYVEQLNMVAPLDRCVPVDVNGTLLNMVAPWTAVFP